MANKIHKGKPGQENAIPSEHQINGTRHTANISGTFNFDWNANTYYVLTPEGAQAVVLGNDNLPTGTNSKEIKGIIKAGSAVTLPANWVATADSDAFDNTLDNHFRAWVSAENVVTYTNKNKAVTGGGGGLTESDIVNTSRQYNNQQNFAAETLIDAASISWDLNTQQSAQLEATTAIGVNRLLPNSVLDSGVNLGEYKIHFNSGDNGYEMQFDTDFKVFGNFAEGVNKITFITLIIDNGIGYILLTPAQNSSANPSNSQALTGTVLDLSNPNGNTYNFPASSNATTYTYTGPTVLGYAVALVNAPSQPTVTGATLIAGNDFLINTPMDMVVRSMDGGTAEYYFVKR